MHIVIYVFIIWEAETQSSHSLTHSPDAYTGQVEVESWELQSWCGSITREAETQLFEQPAAPGVCISRNWNWGQTSSLNPGALGL